MIVPSDASTAVMQGAVMFSKNFNDFFYLLYFFLLVLIFLFFMFYI